MSNTTTTPRETGIFATVTPSPAHTPGQRVLRTIVNVAKLLPGRETEFMLGAAAIEVIRPAGHAVWMISCMAQQDWDVEDYTPIRLRTVAVVPGEFKNWEVVENGRVLGEFRGLEAAISHALDRAGSAALAHTIHEHDSFGC